MMREDIETREFLNSLPWDMLLPCQINLSELMDRIQELYGDSLKDNPTFNGEVFNWMDINEFADYLRSRGYWVHEEVTINYTLFRR